MTMCTTQCSVKDWRRPSCTRGESTKFPPHCNGFLARAARIHTTLTLTHTAHRTPPSPLSLSLSLVVCSTRSFCNVPRCAQRAECWLCDSRHTCGVCVLCIILAAAIAAACTWHSYRQGASCEYATHIAIQWLTHTVAQSGAHRSCRG